MAKINRKKLNDFLINNGVIIVMFVLVIYTGFTSDNFFTSNNLMNILMNISARLVIALGIAGCVITAGCDLSAGRMIGFGGCIAGTLLQKMDYSNKFFPDMEPLNPFIALIIVMLICALFGTVTGFFIAYLSVPPFIATLAMMEIVYGISMIYTKATPLGGYVKAYTDIGSGEMEAIAACTIGGVSVTGGRGRVSSAVIGVTVFELLKVALQYLGVDANAQYIAIGIVIFVAISLDIRKYIAKK